MSIHNPWRGLSSYEDPAVSKQEYLFCGRDRESEELFREIDHNPVVTLYGRSGLGKTSLLNAGVFPLLRTYGYRPIPVRFGTDTGQQDLAEAMLSTIADHCDAHCRLSEEELKRLAAEDQVALLWHYFHTTTFTDRETLEEVYPVLVFDQFEETIMSNREAAILLLRQMHALLGRSRRFPSEAYSAVQNFRFVIALREDYLYCLEDCITAGGCWDLRNCRYRLLPIRYGDARAIVLKPGKEVLDPADSERIADTILHQSLINPGTHRSENPDDAEVNPQMVSLLCSQLFEKAYPQGGGYKPCQITMALLEQEKDTTLRDYYINTIHKIGLSEKQQQFLEERLVSDSRRQSAGYNLLSNNITEEKLVALINMGLLRKFKTATNNEYQVEIIHDQIAVAIDGANKLKKYIAAQDFKKKRHTAIENIIYSCIRGEYVLVVGSECVLRKDEGDDLLKSYNGNSDCMLYKLTAAHLIDDEEYLNEKFRQYTDFEAVGLKEQPIRDAVEWVFKNRFNGANSLSSDLAEPSLRDLIATRCFRVVVTTTIDPFVLWLMEEVWGKGNVRVCNICDTESPGPSLGDYEYYEFPDVPPTLYYAFGTIDTRRIHQSNYHLTDNNILEIISTLIQLRHEERSIINELINYITPLQYGLKPIRPRRLLCIGCDLDNWRYQLFLYLLKGVNISSNHIQGAMVGLICDNLNVYTDSDSREFMRELKGAIDKQHPLCQAGDIYISYAYEDWVEASQLYWLLTAKGCNVWLDDARLGCDGKGTDYDNRIRDAIGQCNVFIPILSDQTRCDLETLPCNVVDIDFSIPQDQWPQGTRFYMKEWCYAQERMDKKDKDNGRSFEVIPFAIRGYESGGRGNHYHNKVPQVLLEATQFSANQRDCISRIMKEIDGIHERNNTRQQ